MKPTGAKKIETKTKGKRKGKKRKGNKKPNKQKGETTTTTEPFNSAYIVLT
jgi:hypothetical protein